MVIEDNVAMSAEQRKAYHAMLDRRKKSAPKKIRADVKQRVIKHSKLKLDEAIDQLNRGQDPTKVFEGWSEARIRAYSQIDKKPNTYYYRFNAPGEKQAHGGWTKVIASNVGGKNFVLQKIRSTWC
jgi:hypothetical protein